jgi:type I restriction enzyme S subunit
MEVMEGFKQTELGIIPKDWDVGLIGDLAIKVGSGITPTGGEKVYKNEGRPFIRSQNVGWGNLLLDDVAFIDEETHASFSATEIRVDDVLLNITGASIGRSAIADKRIESGNVNQHVCIIRVDKNKLAPHYVNLFLLSKMGQKQIDSFQAGGNRQGLNFGQIKSFRFPLPPLPEQHAIAAALSDTDSMLIALDALIAKKLLIKQGTMQELLTGRKRLPGFTAKWEVKKIGEITRTTAGGTPSTLIDSYWGGEIKWMSSGELHLKRVYDVEGRITEEGLKNSSTSIIPPKCVLIGLAGQGKTRGTVAINMVELCTNQSIAAILPSSAFIPEYLYFNFDSRYDELRSISTGDGGRGGLNLTLINKMDVPLPPLPEQIAIAETLSDMDAEIAALEARREKTSLLKQGMMQELLTGKTRLV